MLEKKPNLFFVVLTLFLLAVEIYIGVFVHDRFFRPYVGDMLVVVLLYCMARIWLTKKVRLLPLYVFLFAALVEFLQLFGIAEKISGGHWLLSIVLGQTFDPVDLLCYLAGSLLVVLFLWVGVRFKRKM